VRRQIVEEGLKNKEKYVGLLNLVPRVATTMENYVKRMKER
jgi:hypothetical protein